MKKQSLRLVTLLKKRSEDMNDISECLTKEEECSKMNIEEMKGRPLFALLSNEMNRTRKQRERAREREKEKSQKEREEKRKEKKIQLLFRMTATDELCVFFAFQSGKKERNSGRWRRESR